MTRTLHPTHCRCGLPFLLHPDASLTMCDHCDCAPHVKLHPSMVCPECVRLESEHTETRR